MSSQDLKASAAPEAAAPAAEADPPAAAADPPAAAEDAPAAGADPGVGGSAASGDVEGPGSSSAGVEELAQDMESLEVGAEGMKLFVGNLPYSSESDALRAYFSQFGEVADVILPVDYRTQRPRGFGFVVMPSREEGERAIVGTHEKEFEGRTLRVTEAMSKRRPKQSDKMKLFVGNLSFETTEEDLRVYFGDFGSVVEVFLPLEHETGRPRGFGFVTMATRAEGDAAVAATNDADFGGRTLRVNEARPRVMYPRNGGRGRFGGDDAWDNFGGAQQGMYPGSPYGAFGPNPYGNGGFVGSGYQPVPFPTAYANNAYPPHFMGAYAPGVPPPAFAPGSFQPPGSPAAVAVPPAMAAAQGPVPAAQGAGVGMQMGAMDAMRAPLPPPAYAQQPPEAAAPADGAQPAAAQAAPAQQQRAGGGEADGAFGSAAGNLGFSAIGGLEAGGQW